MVLFYSPKAIGTVQFALAFVALFSFIFNLGFSIAHLKIYPEEDNKAGCIGALITFKIFFIIMALAFYFVLLSILNLDLILTIIIIIFIFEQIFESINSSMTNILMANNEIIKGSFPWIIVSATKIVLLVIGLLIFKTNEVTLSFIYILSTLSHTGFLIPYLISFKIQKPNKLLLKKYLKYTYPLSFSAIAVLIGTNIGFVLINIWISPEAVAFYYVGDHLSVFRTIIPNIISLVMISIFSKNIKENNTLKNKQLIKRISRYFCILWAGIIILSFLYSDEIILLFLGEVYRPSIIIFNILILTQIIIINDIAVLTDLNARGLTKLFSIIKVIGEIYNIFLSILFIAPFGLNLGINGLALSVLVRYLTYTPIVRIYLWKKFKYGYNFEILFYLAAALIVILINPFLTSNLNLLESYYLIPIFIIMDLILYVAILYLFRVIRKEDLKYFKLFLNIKSLINLLYEDLTLKNNNKKTTEKILISD
jgi:O-antigen/teichoic acid export membrane protein